MEDDTTSISPADPNEMPFTREARSLSKLSGEENNETVVVSTVARIPRETGYGDFCFADLTTWENLYEDLHRDKVSLHLTAEELLEGSNNLAIVELESFVRTGKFPFFKLPLEIRERFYRLILHTFFDSNGKINIGIAGEDIDENPKDYNGDFDQFLLLEAENEARQWSDFAGWEMPPHVKPLSTEERESKLEIFLERQSAFRKYISTHPARGKLYYMNACPYRYYYGDEAPVDYGMFALVRSITNVNCQLREEFGRFMWSNVHLYRQCGEDREGMISFVRERPMACSLIKFLSCWFICFSYPDPDETNYVRASQEFFDLVSKSFVLDTLEVHLNLNDSNVEDFLKGEGNFAINSALRPIKVKKDFKLNLQIEITDEFFESPEYDNESSADLVEIWYSRVLEVVMPDSLRGQDSKTSEKIYLDSRKAVVEAEMVEDELSEEEDDAVLDHEDSEDGDADIASN